MIVLVDTNILLDVLQKRQPFHVSADRLWEAVEKRRVEAHVSAISLNNIFYLSRKQATQQASMQAIQRVRQLFQIVPLDLQIIDAALGFPAEDFEDAIQAAAAMRVKADFLITRNIPDFRRFPVSAITADEFFAIHQP